MNEQFGEKVKAIFDSITVLQAKDSDLKRDNANINGDSPMGAMLQYGANSAKEYNLEYLVRPEIAKLHRDGWIHIHDLDFYAWTTTCTQIELRKLFKNGFNTGHGHLRAPKSIGSYAALAAIAIQSNQNDQHGGQSVVDFDYAKGTPSSTPQYPTMTHTADVNQYPLAYIYRKAGAASISQANITSMIGTSSCPYITGILQVLNIDNIVAQWGDQWAQWFTEQTSAGNNQMTSWMDQKQMEFNTWFGNLQTILDGDVAAKLAEDILELQNRFGVLAKEYCIYQSIEDSDNESIEDSYGTSVDGKIVYTVK